MIVDLPNAAWAVILEKLDATSLLRLSNVCQATRIHASDDMAVWKPLCAGHGVYQYQTYNASSFRQLYSKLLHAHAPLLGMWRASNSPIGTLLVAHPDDSTGCLRFSSVLARQLNGRAAVRDIFLVRLDPDSGLEPQGYAVLENHTEAQPTVELSIHKVVTELKPKTGHDEFEFESASESELEFEAEAEMEAGELEAESDGMEAEVESVEAENVEAESDEVEAEAESEAESEPHSEYASLSMSEVNEPKPDSEPDEPEPELEGKHDSEFDLGFTVRFHEMFEYDVCEAIPRILTFNHLGSAYHLPPQLAEKLLNPPSLAPSGELQWPEVAPPTSHLHQLEQLSHMHHTELQLRHWPDRGPLNVAQFVPLRVPPGRHVLEGLWRGCYGGHGVEVLSVHVDDQQPVTLEVVKVTGDVNIPAGETTFSIYLDEPLSIHPEGVPFVLPPGFHSRVELQAAGTERLVEYARYKASGQVAREGFRDSAFLEIQAVQFGNDCFGVLWRALRSFSIFTRLQL